MIDFNLQNARFDYEPYPICYIPNFLSPELYRELVATYPDRELFRATKNIGVKYSLSELNNPDNYYQFFRQHTAWREFFELVKSKDFVQRMAGFLRDHHIDLRIEDFVYVKSLGYRRRDPIRRIFNTQVIRSRFEFSSMPAADGSIKPHTDAPSKLITLVVSMIQENEWNEAAWGGGTSVVMPRDRTRVYNHFNKYMDFADVEVVKTFPFVPNQCVLFVKTYNSWHSVQPMTGPESALRKTLTINIEDIP